MSSYGVLPVVASATAAQPLVRTVLSVVRPYTDGGDTVRRVAQCKAHYGVVLLQSGTALLLAPAVPGLHGVVLNRYCSARSAETEGGQGDAAERVVDIAAGASHIVLCTATGAVWSFGYDNSYGQLGDGTIWPAPPPSRVFQPHVSAAARCVMGSPPLSLPRQLEGFGTSVAVGDATNAPTPTLSRRIAAVACGTTHTLLLTAEGNCVYGCGRGHRGQLGTGRVVAIQAIPRAIRLLFGLAMAHVVAAADHSFVLLRSGRLFAFGDNTCGQLGVGHTGHLLSPTVVPVRDGGGGDASEAAANDALRPREDTATVSKAGRACDAKACSSLRAPYASPESMYYPLRVRRLDERPGGGEAVVVQMWAGATTTVLRTRRGDWLSCGLAPSRSVRAATPPRGPDAAASAEARVARYDGYGVLGRPLRARREAYYFGKMRCTERVRTLVQQQHGGDEDDDECALPPPGEDDKVVNSQMTGAGRSVASCLCYSQAVVIALHEPLTGQPTLVVHSSLPYTMLCRVTVDGEADQQDKHDALADSDDAARQRATRPLLRLPQVDSEVDAVRHGGDGGNAADDAVVFQLDAATNVLPLQDSVLVW